MRNGALMGARLGLGAAVLVVGATWAASATPVPPPRDAAAEAPPLTAQAAPEKAPRPDDPSQKSPPVAPRPAVSASDRPMIQRLHDANQMEIQMGRLAQEKGASRLVKNFGRQLVADHTAADKRLDDYLRR